MSFGYSNVTFTSTRVAPVLTYTRCDPYSGVPTQFKLEPGGLFLSPMSQEFRGVSDVWDSFNAAECNRLFNMIRSEQKYQGESQQEWTHQQSRVQRPLPEEEDTMGPDLLEEVSVGSIELSPGSIECEKKERKIPLVFKKGSCRSMVPKYSAAPFTRKTRMKTRNKKLLLKKSLIISGPLKITFNWGTLSRTESFLVKTDHYATTFLRYRRPPNIRLKNYWSGCQHVG